MKAEDLRLLKELFVKLDENGKVFKLSKYIISIKEKPKEQDKKINLNYPNKNN